MVVLNGHLRRYGSMGLSLRDCDDFTTSSLRALLEDLRARSRPELLAIYAPRRDLDPRHVEEGGAMERAAQQAAADGGHEAALRDALCHDAVLVFVHHLAEQDRRAWQAEGRELPLLPILPHDLTKLAKPVAEKYESSIQCTRCHQAAPYEPDGSPGDDPEAPKWPPVLPPLFPTRWTAKSHGFQMGPSGSVVLYNDSVSYQNCTTQATWHYDFPKNRLLADFVDYVNGTFRRRFTEYWVGNGLAPEQGEMLIYQMLPADGRCIYYNVSGDMGLGLNTLVRPDAFIQAEAEHHGRMRSLDKPDRWVDRWAAGNCSLDCFEADFDIESLVPIKFYGTGGGEGGVNASNDSVSAFNVFDAFEIGAPDERVFEEARRRVAKGDCVQVKACLELPCEGGGAPRGLGSPHLTRGKQRIV